MRRMVVVLGALAAIAGGLTGCGSPPPAALTTPPGVNENLDVVSGIAADPALAALLPAAVRQSHTLVVAEEATPNAPFQFFVDGNTRHIGLEIDLRDAVARVLGLAVSERLTGFESMLPGLADGKYQVAQGNFGVTEQRKKTIDFVTYYDDGYGLAVPAGSPVTKVTAFTDLCGLRVGTNLGTDFAASLQENVKQCDGLGRTEYTLSTYHDRAAGLLALSQHHVDIYMLTAMGLEYQSVVTHGQLVYLGKLPGEAEHNGFALPKGSPLAAPIQAAMQRLIDTGAYARILAKWRLTDAAIARSVINPPGLT